MTPIRNSDFWEDVNQLIEVSAACAVKAVLFHKYDVAGHPVPLEEIDAELVVVMKRVSEAVQAVKGNRRDLSPMTFADARAVLRSVHESLARYLDPAPDPTGG